MENFIVFSRFRLCFSPFLRGTWQNRRPNLQSKSRYPIFFLSMEIYLFFPQKKSQISHSHLKFPLRLQHVNGKTISYEFSDQQDFLKDVFLFFNNNNINLTITKINFF